jgi:error-prone DNA polymerase
MAAWKRRGGVHKFHDLLVQRMQAKGYTAEYAEGIFSQIVGFGEYGFPESHAASFAQLVYVSAWLKRHEPACFLAALINSQPMGFYAPTQLVQDAQRHGITVLPADVSHSDWDCTIKQLESDPNCSDSNCLVRLGLCLVAGLAQTVGERVVTARQAAGFASVEDLALRAGLDRGDLRALAAADALASLAGHRRQQVWDASALQPAPPLLQGVPVQEPRLLLPAADEGQEVLLDYASTGLTLRSHPLSLLRSSLSKMKLMTAAELHGQPDGRLVRACGLVTMRQQPGTAKGVMFVTLEDETGCVNVIVWKSLRERQRTAAVQSRLLAVHGVWQRDTESGGEVRHLIAGHLRDLTPLLGGLSSPSREFH